MQKKKIGGEGDPAGGERELRISLCEKAKKDRGGGPGLVGCGGLGGCEQIIEVIVKMQKKKSGGEFRSGRGSQG